MPKKTAEQLDDDLYHLARLRNEILLKYQKMAETEFQQRSKDLQADVVRIQHDYMFQLVNPKGETQDTVDISTGEIRRAPTTKK
jgi:hypothetical protein